MFGLCDRMYLVLLTLRTIARNALCLTQFCRNVSAVVFSRHYGMGGAPIYAVGNNSFVDRHTSCSSVTESVCVQSVICARAKYRAIGQLCLGRFWGFGNRARFPFVDTFEF